MERNAQDVLSIIGYLGRLLGLLISVGGHTSQAGPGNP